MRRAVVAVAVATLMLSACGAPTIEEARVRQPSDGATLVFDRPYEDVYLAAKQVVEDALRTPEWNMLRIVVDDPAEGVLIAEQALRGVIPGLQVRELWSFYLARRDPEHTSVTFVLDASDQLAASRGARSWMKARGTIFPAIADALARLRAGESEGPVSGTRPGSG